MDAVDPMRFVLAFLFVLGLIGVFALVLKRYGASQKIFGPSLLGGKDGGGRIAVVEMRYIDAKRKLVLVRRDRVEHLLLIAPDRELVVESNIAVSMMDAPHPTGVDPNA